MKNTPLTAWIIEDEEPMAESLKRKLDKVSPKLDDNTPAVVVTDVFLSATKINTDKGLPDVIFLDIEMPNMDGRQFAEKVWDKTEIVFTTGHPEYALEAHEFHNFDFLLKPIDDNRLLKTIEELEKKISKKQTEIVLSEHRFGKIIAVPTVEATYFVKVNDIIRVEAKGNCSEFIIEGTKPITTAKTLRSAENLLARYPNFFRCHKSHLINTQFLIRMETKEGIVFILKNGDEVPVSRELRKEFFDIIRDILL